VKSVVAVRTWKQKGTGRARHGSIRSPIWVGGGVTFGPRSDHNFSKKLKQKIEAERFGDGCDRQGQERRLDCPSNRFRLKPAKPKRWAAMLAKLPVGRKVLVILPKSDKMVIPALPAISRDSHIQHG